MFPQADLSLDTTTTPSAAEKGREPCNYSGDATAGPNGNRGEASAQRQQDAISRTPPPGDVTAFFRVMPSSSGRFPRGNHHRPPVKPALELFLGGPRAQKRPPEAEDG